MTNEDGISDRLNTGGEAFILHAQATWLTTLSSLFHMPGYGLIFRQAGLSVPPDIKEKRPGCIATPSATSQGLNQAPKRLPVPVIPTGELLVFQTIALRFAAEVVSHSHEEEPNHDFHDQSLLEFGVLFPHHVGL